MSTAACVNGKHWRAVTLYFVRHWYWDIRHTNTNIYLYCHIDTFITVKYNNSSVLCYSNSRLANDNIVDDNKFKTNQPHRCWGQMKWRLLCASAQRLYTLVTSGIKWPGGIRAMILVKTPKKCGKNLCLTITTPIRNLLSEI